MNWLKTICAGAVLMTCVQHNLYAQRIKSGSRDHRNTTVYVEDTGRQEYMPVLLRGDREFDGNGPFVRVKVEYLVERNILHRRISMRGSEDVDFGKILTGQGNNGTKFGGWCRKHPVYKAPTGKTIVGIGRGFDKTVELYSGTMKGHKPKTVASKVGDVTVWGDRKGLDIGHYTKVAIDFDHILPVIVADGTPQLRTVHLPWSIEIKPAHTAGDKDFHGHGPRISVDGLIARSDTRVTFVLAMTAEELIGGFENDFTKAAGRKEYVMFTAPKGYRIKAVHGRVDYRGLIDKYVDKGHGSEMITTALGRAHVFGDRKGDDAGVYTRVVFKDIEHSVEVEVEPK